MCKLSCEQCVCFVFLVIVAFLSCFGSGFRIDKSTMSSPTAHHSRTTSTDLLHRLLDADFLSHNNHRIRHAKHRHLHVESTTTESSLIQIPPSDISTPKPTHAIINRSQRSPRRKNQRPKKTKRKCQQPDIARKAALANTVVKASVESMSAKREKNMIYNVTFKILYTYKSIEPPTHTIIRLTFEYDKPDCEFENETGLVKAKVRPRREYFLFLNSHGSYNYTVNGLPVLVTRNVSRTTIDQRRIKKACREGFAEDLDRPIVRRVYADRENRITCKAKGFPVPMIYWYKNNQKIHSSRKHRILYSGKRSTLILPKSDRGKYKCVTKGVNRTEAASVEVDDRDSLLPFPKHEVRPLDKGTPCNHTMKNFCITGECFVTANLGERYCVCPNDYMGIRCEEKSSTYQQNITSCNLPQYRSTHFCQ